MRMRIISFEVATYELPQPTPALVIKQPKNSFPSSKNAFPVAAPIHGELVILPLTAKHCQPHRLQLRRNFSPVLVHLSDCVGPAETVGLYSRAVSARRTAI
jgi:hypothetical protein